MQRVLEEKRNMLVEMHGLALEEYELIVMSDLTMIAAQKELSDEERKRFTERLEEKRRENREMFQMALGRIVEGQGLNEENKESKIILNGNVVVPVGLSGQDGHAGGKEPKTAYSGEVVVPVLQEQEYVSGSVSRSDNQVQGKGEEVRVAIV